MSAFLSANSSPTSVWSPFALTPSILTTIIYIIQPLFHSEKMNALDWWSSSPTLFSPLLCTHLCQKYRQAANGQVNMDDLSLTKSSQQVIASWFLYFLLFPKLCPSVLWLFELNRSLCACVSICLFVSVSRMKFSCTYTRWPRLKGQLQSGQNISLQCHLMHMKG